MNTCLLSTNPRMCCTNFGRPTRSLFSTKHLEYSAHIPSTTVVRATLSYSLPAWDVRLLGERAGRRPSRGAVSLASLPNHP